MHTTVRGNRRHPLLTILTTLALALSALALGSVPAYAAPTSPEGLSPSGDAAPGIPVLQWERVPGAVNYDVQVSANDQFTSTVFTASKTVNNKAVPTKPLPNGTLHWRVLARDASGAVSPWTRASFSNTQVKGPTLLTPANGQTLQQPRQPVTLSWTAIQGVTNYTIQISQDASFINEGLITTYTTSNTSYVVPTPQPNQDFYWRVRGNFGGGIVTHWSSGSRSYKVAPLEEAKLTDDSSNDHTNAVEEFVLDWKPIPAAKSYDLQISTVDNFSTFVHTKSGIRGTRYSPPRTLNDNSYYWRVRGVDAGGNAQPWETASTTWKIRREWSEQPSLEYPENTDTVGDPFFFQWSPVRLASSYRVDVSRDRNFSPGYFESCSTTNTVLTPSNPASDDCWPTADGHTYYWRVVATDGFASPPPSTQLAHAEIGEFQYLPQKVQLKLPLANTTTDLPVFSWHPHRNAARYRIQVYKVGESSPKVNVVTSATTYTPRTTLAEGAYRWDVVPISEDNREGAFLADANDWQRVTIAGAPPAEASSPEPLTPSFGAESVRFPGLTWTAVAGATKYNIEVRRSSSLSWTPVSGSFEYPAGDDLGNGFIDSGTYRWRVKATVPGSDPVYGSEGEFRIVDPTQVVGHKVALTGTEMTLGTDGSNGTPRRVCSAARCENLRQQPLLEWDPVPGAGYYLVYISDTQRITDSTIRKEFGRQPVPVNGTRWIPNFALPDSNADSAYYWHVRPCKADGHCAALGDAEHAFNKLGTSVALASPADDPTGEEKWPDDITFDWDDYLWTNDNTLGGPGTALDTPPTLEAQYYQVEVATDANFQAVVDRAEVDQTTYTAFDKIYPEANLWWRVRAFDGTGNPMPWSESRRFVKRSPPPENLAPAGNPEVSGHVRLTWDPPAYASTYELEIYEGNNTDAQPQPADIVVDTTSKLVTWAPANPLPVGEYVWRVRRNDAGGEGEWSGLEAFTVVGAATTPAAPVNEAGVAAMDALLSWTAVDEAASYRVEWRKPNAVAFSEAATTSALSWAPPTTLEGGRWTWRVVTRNSDGKDLRASEDRTFVVVNKPTATTPPTVQGSGAVGTLVTSLPPAWDIPAKVDNTYQWLRNGSPIAGATDASYLVTPADVGKTLVLRVTGTSPGYVAGTADSAPVTAARGSAPISTSGPFLTGSGAVGTTLSGSAPTWNQDDVATTYQWLRNGDPISRATSLTYTVTTSDLGQSLSLRAIGKKTGYADGVAFSNAIIGAAGPAPTATSAPSISGTPAYGNRLKVNPGTWSGSPKLAYQWLRNGAPIPGATGSSYTVTVADAAQAIAVYVSASATGMNTGSAVSGAVRVAKLSSTTTAAGSSTGKAGKKYKLSVTVAVPGVSRPTGKIKVKDGSKVVKTVSMGAAKGGRMTIKIKGLKKGKHKLKAFYLGNPVTNGSKSGKVKVVLKK